MGKIIDETGKQYGYLTVIKMLDERSARSDVQFQCKCNCGNEVVATGSALRSGKKKSCGCLKIEVARINGGQAINSNYKQALLRNRREIIIRRLYNETVVRRHGSKNFVDDMFTLEEFSELIEQDCYYCGAAPSLIAKDRVNSGIEVMHNGIDRIDSSIGYVSNNARSCCSTCNQAKNILSEEEFYSWIKRISLFQQARGNI